MEQVFSTEFKSGIIHRYWSFFQILRTLIAKSQNYNTCNTRDRSELMCAPRAFEEGSSLWSRMQTSAGAQHARHSDAMFRGCDWRHGSDLQFFSISLEKTERFSADRCPAVWDLRLLRFLPMAIMCNVENVSSRGPIMTHRKRPPRAAPMQAKVPAHTFSLSSRCSASPCV